MPQKPEWIVKKSVIAIIALALLPAAGYAQTYKGPPTARSDYEKKTDAEIDQAYRQAIKAPEQKPKPTKVDPWQSVRPADADNIKR